MAARSAFDRWGRYVVAALLSGVIGWFAFVGDRPVPLLDWFDLGVHETGHLLAAFLPTMVMFIAGSFAQVAVPLSLAWYFGYRRRDAAGGGFCLAWAGTSMWDVSVYIADAPVQALPLIGGGQHDWAYLLGRNGWDALHLADEIAGFVEFTGGVATALGIGTALWAAWVGYQSAEGPSTAPADPPLPVTAGVDPWKAAAELPFHHRPEAGT